MGEKGFQKLRRDGKNLVLREAIGTVGADILNVGKSAGTAEDTRTGENLCG